MEDQVTYQTLTEDVSDQPQGANEIQSLRNELLSFAEKHGIKKSVTYIMKASHSALEKIKGEYERKQRTRGNQRIPFRDTHE